MTHGLYSSYVHPLTDSTQADVSGQQTNREQQQLQQAVYQTSMSTPYSGQQPVMWGLSSGYQSFRMPALNLQQQSQQTSVMVQQGAYGPFVEPSNGELSV